MVARLSRRSKLFSRGWGDELVLAESSDRARYLAAPAPVKVAWQPRRKHGSEVCRDGTFQSPLGALPDAVRTVHVRAWSREGSDAACVMLAASRDEGYWIRERVFGPLTGRGIDLYLLENPYYGLRRDGRGPSDITVSDHGLMALAMVLEARALLHHLRNQYDKLVVAGYSMGGHMAALTAAVTPLPVACAALATGASASAIYTRGMLSWSVDFDSPRRRSDRKRGGTRPAAKVVRYCRCELLSSTGPGGCDGGFRMYPRRVCVPERNRATASSLEGEYAALDRCRTFFGAADPTTGAVRLRGRGGRKAVMNRAWGLRLDARCEEGLCSCSALQTS